MLALTRLAPLLLATVLSRPLAAQRGADSAAFVVRRGADTVAVETFGRDRTHLGGTLVIWGAGGFAERWSAVVAPDATVPLIEVAVTPTADTLGHRTQRARLIFRDDSVAIDGVTGDRLDTRVLGTQTGAVPYINLSFALLEQALRRGLVAGTSVPLFNLGGGQTAVASVERRGSAAARLALGPVAIDLTTDAEGRILSARIDAQNLRVERVAVR